MAARTKGSSNGSQVSKSTSILIEYDIMNSIFLTLYFNLHFSQQITEALTQLSIHQEIWTSMREGRSAWIILPSYQATSKSKRNNKSSTKVILAKILTRLFLVAKTMQVSFWIWFLISLIAQSNINNFVNLVMQQSRGQRMHPSKNGNGSMPSTNKSGMNPGGSGSG